MVGARTSAVPAGIELVTAPTFSAQGRKSRVHKKNAYKQKITPSCEEPSMIRRETWLQQLPNVTEAAAFPVVELNIVRHKRSPRNGDRGDGVRALFVPNAHE